jgi:tRNA(adenine34) deaminase
MGIAVHQQQDFDLGFMQRALELANVARDEGEVPVGAVVVRDGEIIGEGYNRVIGDADPSAHAEMQALRAAAKVVGNYRLPGTTLYVTLEPCCMCAGTIIHARVGRLVFAADDPKTGAVGGCFDLLADSRHNHKVEVKGSFMAEESANILREFFRLRR